MRLSAGVGDVDDPVGVIAAHGLMNFDESEPLQSFDRLLEVGARAQADDPVLACEVNNFAARRG